MATLLLFSLFNAHMQGRKLTHNRGLIVTNGAIHDAVLEAVRAVLPPVAAPSSL